MTLPQVHDWIAATKTKLAQREKRHGETSYLRRKLQALVALQIALETQLWSGKGHE